LGEIKKLIMKKYLLVVGLFLSSQIFAQTGIGTTTPHASAKLDVSATNKGFLPPRVTLTSNTDVATIPIPAEGLLVYNLGSSGLQAGYYYWNGANWATIATASSTGSGLAASNLVNLYAKAYSMAIGDIANASGHTFTVPVSGRYLFDFSSTCFANSMTFSVRQGTTVLASDAQTSVNNSVHVEYNGKMEVNLQSGVTYNVYVSIGTGYRDAGDYDRVYYKLVAGNLPVNQHLASANIQLNNNYLSNDGGNEGIRIDNSGNVGIGTTSPTVPLDINGAVNASTLSISNTSTGVSSLILKNGDAAASFSDNPQIRMGWSGSSAGTNQYAQIIHTRHNSGPTNNSIDFYLSNGTANNTITTGSTKAMSIESPGNLTVAGKINLTDPSGNVVVKAAGFVNAGDYVTLGNLKATIPSGLVNKSLQLATVSGTYSVYGSGVHVFSSNLGSTTINSGSPKTISTTPAYLNSGNTFGTFGGTDTWNIMDTSNFIMWRITAIIGSGYNANFISIERLL
jgi:hypothetical protein